jgi:hypothetical protein
MIRVGLNIVKPFQSQIQGALPGGHIRSDAHGYCALTGIQALSGAIPTFCSRRDRKMSDQFDTLFDSFVISLKRTPERLRDFRTHNSKCGIDVRHFEAIDGAEIDASEIEGRFVAKGAIGYKPAIVGNAMSHRSLWQRCTEQKKHLSFLRTMQFFALTLKPN